MTTSKAVPKASSEVSGAMLEARNNFHLQLALGVIQPKSNTHWEEIKCIGYNPEMRRLEAIVDIKQSTGYSGGLCTNASHEYVRFFVDFKDAGGFRDMGMASFKSADISDAPPGPQHPLSYMVYLYINDEQYRRFTDCKHAVIPTMRAILSWNVVPTPNTPSYPPHYGNVRDADIQLKKREFLIAKDVFDLAKQPLKNLLAPELQIPLPDPQPVNVKELYEVNKKAGVPDHRTFFSTIGAAIHSPMNFSQAVAQFNIGELAALKVDPSKIIGILNAVPNEKEANVTFEELTCVGLNSDTDTLGAVVHVKKSTGYGGDLCHKGSMEHVAFWADWDNNGTFDQYLGTVSFETHDISNIPAGGLYYNVTLPFDVSKRLKSCKTPNILRVRAVLSWESLPSTINPNQLNTWGNSIDALVQLRPGRESGIHTIISLVGNVDRLMIDPAKHLYNYNAFAPTINNNRPWGDGVNLCGIIDRNGFNGVIKYRLSYKPYGAPDADYLPASHNESFGRWNSALPVIPGINPSYVPQTADSDGWYIYDVNPALGIFDIWDNGLLANLNAGALADGTYTIRFEYTDEMAVPQIGDVFSIVICNQDMSVSPTANTVVDLTRDIDLVIDGGDCHSYSKADTLINGHLRAVHPYFGWWTLDLQPTSHTNGSVPSPTSRYYSSVGDAGDSNTPWTLDTKPLDPCGYTVSLSAHTRVILGSSPGYFPYYGPKAVGFAKQL
jgi:hypothetical protein